MLQQRCVSEVRHQRCKYAADPLTSRPVAGSVVSLRRLETEIRRSWTDPIPDDPNVAEFGDLGLVVAAGAVQLSEETTPAFRPR